MKGINKVILIGNMCKNPEYKMLQNGTSVAKLTIATTESYRLKNGGITTNTEWHPVILWCGLADFVNQYIYKGSPLYIEGKLWHRQYEDKEAQKKYVTEIAADQVILLDKKAKDTEKNIENIQTSYSLFNRRNPNFFILMGTPRNYYFLFGIII